MKPKISVIISAHKPSPYLIACINSVLSQEFKGFEVILSSDGCEELERYTQYTDIKIKVSSKGNNSIALNNAVRICEGEYIKEVHYDDLLMPDALKSLWISRGASVVYGGAVSFFEDRQDVYFMPPYEVTWDMLFPPFKNAIHGAAFMFRKDDFLEVGGFDENIDYAEEYEFYLRMLAAGKTFKRCNAIISKYRRHTEQKTQRFHGPLREVVRHYIHSKYGEV